MKRTFWISLLTEDTNKEKYTHQKLLELYIENPLLWRKYLSSHIWYFISNTRRTVSEWEYHSIASDAIYLIDQQILKQLNKWWPTLNPVKLWRYLILRLWWHLMNQNISNSKNECNTYDQEYSNASTIVWYDSLMDNLLMMWLDTKEALVVSMKMNWYWERDIFSECDINREWIKSNLSSWLKKVKEHYNLLYKDIKWD